MNTDKTPWIFLYRKKKETRQTSNEFNNNSFIMFTVQWVFLLLSKPTLCMIIWCKMKTKQTEKNYLIMTFLLMYWFHESHVANRIFQRIKIWFFCLTFFSAFIQSICECNLREWQTKQKILGAVNVAKFRISLTLTKTNSLFERFHTRSFISFHQLELLLLLTLSFTVFWLLFVLQTSSSIFRMQTNNFFAI